MFYNERLATQYLEYNVELANEYLDRAGYSERDAQGFHLGPDSNRTSFTLENSSHAQDRTDMMGLIQGYWREVDIDMKLRAINRSGIHKGRTSIKHSSKSSFH